MMSESTRRRKSYSCIHCEKEGKQYVTAQYKMIAHVYKNHLPLAKAPFYCKLCLFRCNTRATLVNHVSQYGRHKWAASQIGESEPYSQSHCVVNPSPVTVQLGSDFRELTMQEELSHRSTVSELDGFFENETEFLCDTPGQTHVSGPPQPNSTSGFISVQLTPEQLTVLLQSQPQLSQSANQQVILPKPKPAATSTLQSLSSRKTTNQLRLSENNFPLHPAPQTPPALKGDFLLATTTTINTVPVMSQNLYSPQPFHRTYVPTPISMKSKMSPIVSTSLLSRSCTSQHPPLQPPAISDPVQNFGTLSRVNTPSMAEDLRPQLLGRESLGGYDGFEDEFTTWLNRETEDRQENPVPVVSAEEPLPKKQRMEEKEEFDRVSDENPKPVESWLVAMESLMEKATGTFKKAMEDGARAVRGVDKTLQTLAETMAKVNRTIERIGEEMRREHERRWEAEERKAKEETKKGDQNTERRNSTGRREADKEQKGKENKENKPLKSVVNKK